MLGYRYIYSYKEAKVDEQYEHVWSFESNDRDELISTESDVTESQFLAVGILS